MTAAPVAGWYPDPVSEELLRWWDGAGWREETVPRPQTAPAAAPQPAMSFAESRFAPTAEAEASEPEIVTIAPIVIQPALPVQDWRPVRVATAGAWSLSFLPWITEVLVVVGAIAYTMSGTLPFAVLVPATIAAIALLLSVAFVIRDRRMLEELGHQKVPSAWWVLLGPLPYLIARTVRVHQNAGKGAGPLVVFLLNSAAVGAVNAAVILFVVPALYGSVPSW